MIRWSGFGNGWDKCRECWLAYQNNVQHRNSLNCFKLGIPIKSLKVDLKQFLQILDEKNYVGKYSLFSFPISLLSKGVIILYFSTEEEMREAISQLRQYVRGEPEEKWFFEKFVNVDWIDGFNYRRGCPEYDSKFGDWRNWKKE